MTEVRFVNDVSSWVTGLKQVEIPGLGTFCDAIAVAEITTTSQTILNLKYRSGQADRSDTSGAITVPSGSQILGMGMRIPSGIVATNGDRLKLATAVGATGTQVFNNSSSTAYVASSVAASTTFAEETVRFWESLLGTNSGVKTNADASFKVYNDNGTTGAGSGVSVASGVALVVVRILYQAPPTIPLLERVAGRPARAS